MDVAAFCAQQHRAQKNAGAAFGLSWDHFGRSSSPQNHALTTHFARQLWRRGHLELRTTKQVFSRTDNRFLPDRYVIGICPHCGYPRARGDQCENCTRVLDPVELIEPRSAISGSTEIEIRDSTHLFLRQSRFVGQLREWIASHDADWPVLVTSIANKWLDEGLHDRGITRDVSWGVPVPDDIGEGKLKGKVFYVWFDAPIGYMARTREYYAAIGYTTPYRWAHYVDAPFQPLRKPLDRSRLAIVTTAAPFDPAKGDQGPGAKYNGGAKFYSVYDGDASKTHDLRISHIAYDRVHSTDDDSGCGEAVEPPAAAAADMACQPTQRQSR